MRILFVLLICMSLTACSKPQPPQTIEEDVWVSAFAGFVETLMYDAVCNKTDQKSRLDLTKIENKNIAGTHKMFARRIGILTRVRYPEQSANETMIAFMYFQKKIEKQAQQRLHDDGCESETGKADAKLLGVYSTKNSLYIMHSIEGIILRKGGKITSSDETEAANNPVTSADSLK